MRRREKFVIASALLSLGLFVVQYIPLEFRYLAVGIFGVLTYIVSAWALADDLQKLEWLTIVPFPSLYAIGVGLFYFLLPTSILSKVFVLVLFGLGMYALFLTSNIFSVAKERTIQLLHAAHAIGLLFTLLTSLLFTNTLFSLRLPFFMVGLGIGIVHFPLILMSLWSIGLEKVVRREIVGLAGLLTLLLMEIGIALSFYPLSVWNNALFIMTWAYIGLGIVHNFLRGRLFSKTMTEYSLVAGFVCVVFAILFPLK
jgi:hypothetical protein